MWKCLLAWILPAVCPGCRWDLVGPGPVCPTCWAALSLPSPAPAPTGVDRYGAVAAFEPPLRDLILSFKYRGRDYLGKALAARLAERAPAWIGECTVVVPVPSPAVRRIRRGYHPADVLAASLGRFLRRPVVFSALRRRHGFPSQTALDRHDRGENAMRSF